MKKYRSILAIILMCLLVIIVGTYAWLSWKSNETGLKLTIGSIENVRLTISPYKIDSSIIPTLTYEGEKYSQIEIINNGIDSKNLELYYEINNIDEELINEDFMYTIEKSIDGVTYSKYKEGNFNEVTIDSEFIILTETIPTNTKYEYRVYVWLNGEDNNSGTLIGKSFSGELRGRITEYVPIFEEYTYEELSSNYACADPNNSETLITVGNPIFTYTGNCEVVDDGNGNWKVRFLTSGDFTSKSSMLIDAFLVGGGGGGAVYSKDDKGGGGGGGGGYTTTTFVNVNANISYEIIIGTGGTTNNDGTATTAFSAIANGGTAGRQYTGGSGGSGGASYSASEGGSDGKNGNSNGSGIPGTGQRTTTCEFGESGCSNDLLYSGGGGSGSATSTPGNGGIGGGGKGGKGTTSLATNGVDNTGGGGGGSGYKATSAGIGGSGIVVIRNTRNVNSIEKMPNVGFEFEYTGNYAVINDGDGNWRIKFLTSGTFTSNNNMLIDAFLVGGGGGGGLNGRSDHGGGGGGGGGYTITTFTNIIANASYEITIGNGGLIGTDGEATTAFNSIANGGKKGNGFTGGNGGSGGASYSGVNGGANGANGEYGTSGPFGNGQGTTTCEFGEDGCNSILLYSGGGGSGNATSTPGNGGDGGGGNGGKNYSPGTHAIVNTGGGGGSSGYINSSAGIGGSGIVVIRNIRNTNSIEQLPSVGFDFEYTGNYTIINDGSGNWRIKFLTSGTFKSSKDLQIDAFLVGGGGGGGLNGASGNGGGGGGGGGYTTTISTNIVANNPYEIVIGNGGLSNNDGEATTAFNSIADGGKKGDGYKGGDGGSGGASYSISNGGSNGSNGAKGSSGTSGTGQGTTTCEFGEDGCNSTLLYSGGGGSGTADQVPGTGGVGGGGNGGKRNSKATNGTDNRGGGGGGSGYSNSSAGAGGSGIVVIRNTRE